MSRPALAATRAVAVLNFLAAHPAEEFTLSDLASRLGINVASAHALLGVLADAGYVVRHPRLRTYALGPSVVALGSAALERHAAIDLARDAARDLAREVELEVAVTAPAGDEIVFLARAGEEQARGIPVHVGQRVPLVPPLGAVFVAWGDDARTAWLARAAGGGGLRAVLDGVRRRGYSIALEHDARKELADALDHLADTPVDTALRGTVGELVADLGDRDYQVVELDGERTYDVSMIAAPVFGPGGEVVLALTLVGFDAGLPGTRIAVYGERVRAAGLVVTKRSGGRALPADDSSGQVVGREGGPCPGVWKTRTANDGATRSRRSFFVALATSHVANATESGSAGGTASDARRPAPSFAVPLHRFREARSWTTRGEGGRITWWPISPPW